MKAAIYTRISMDRQGERAGVERQRSDCERLCEERGWTVVGIFEDNDRSAYSGRERPEYERVLSAVAGGEVEAVVAWHSDRLWRNVLEQQTFLALGRSSGLKLVATPSADFDPDDGDDAFMSTLLTAVAQKESADKSRRMKRRQQEKAERGEYHGGPPGFGYRTAGVGQLEIVPEQAEIIRECARRILSGETTRSVAIDLDSRGIRTTTGKVWRVDTVARLMQNPRVAGLRVVDGRNVEGSWPAILDRETHERLVAIFDARRRGPRERAKKHLLSGMVRCGKCGAPMVVATIRGVLRYRCPPRGMGGCNGVSVVAHEAEPAAVDKVLRYLDSPQFGKAMARVRRSASKEDKAVTAALEQLSSDRERLVELGDWLGDGRLDLDTYKRQTQRLNARVVENERVISRASAATPAASYEGQAEKLRVAWEHMTTEERRLVLSSLVERFRIDPAPGPGPVFNADRVVPEWRFR